MTALFSCASIVILLLGTFSSIQSFAPSPSLSIPVGFVRSVHPTHQNNQCLRRPILSASLSSGGGVGDDDDDNNNEDEPAPEDFIVSAGDLDDEPTSEGGGEEVEDILPSWYEHQQRLIEIRTKYRRHETDTGSPEYQVAGMTERISYLTKHLKVHPNDFSTRRGLVALVNKRRRILNYLFREDVNRYRELVGSLGVNIRHKPPSRVQTREGKYGRFPPQKDKKKNN